MLEVGDRWCGPEVVDTTSIGSAAAHVQDADAGLHREVVYGRPGPVLSLPRYRFAACARGSDRRRRRCGRCRCRGGGEGGLEAFRELRRAVRRWARGATGAVRRQALDEGDPLVGRGFAGLDRRDELLVELGLLAGAENLTDDPGHPGGQGDQRKTERTSAQGCRIHALPPSLSVGGAHGKTPSQVGALRDGWEPDARPRAPLRSRARAVCCRADVARPCRNGRSQAQCQLRTVIFSHGAYLACWGASTGSAWRGRGAAGVRPGLPAQVVEAGTGSPAVAGHRAGRRCCETCQSQGRVRRGVGRD